MLTPRELEAMPIQLEQYYRQLEESVMLDIVRRMKNNGNDIIRSADWQINRLHELGKTKEEIKNEIQKALNISSDEVTAIYDNAIKAGYSNNADVYKEAGIEQVPYKDNKELQQLVSGLKEQTNGEFKNITQSLGFAVKGANGKIQFTPIADYYQKTLDGAILGIASGVFDYNTALKKAINEMTNSGLRSVDYASGWSNRVDVAARRAVMTGITQLTAKVNEDMANDLGTNTYEVSWHSGARPEHAEWQGGVYTYEELESICGLGDDLGLCGINCYHSYSPFIEGISERTYTDEELEQMREEENTPKEFNGKKYTAYEAQQRQRRLETTMRAERQKIKLLKEGGADEEDIIRATARYRGTSAEYSRFSKAMGLPQQRERVYGDGLGSVGKGKYKIPVEKSGKSGIIELYKRKGIEVVSSPEISSKTIKQVEKATKKVTSDFKVLETYSEPIVFSDVIDGLAENSYDPNTGLNKITLRKVDFANPDKLLELLHNDFISGKSYETDTIQSLVAHEMGHNAHVALALKRTNLLYGKPLTSEQTYLFDIEYKKIAEEIYIKSFDSKLSLEEIEKQCAKQLGTFTVFNSPELIAQSFGNYYYGNNKSKIAKKIVDYFKKELK